MILEIIALLVVVAALLLTGWNVRRVRTARRARAIPTEVRERVLAAIDRAGTRAGTPLLLLRVVEGPPRDPYSKVGGTPRLPPGTSLPTSAQGSERFLAQVRLQSPPLSEVWTDLLVLLFRGADEPIVACCVGRAEPLSDSAEQPSDGTGIEFLRLPTGMTAAADSAPYDARVLFGLVPEVEPLLSNFADAPARLLPHILSPGIPTHEIDTFLVSLMGGSPELIQGPHAATCSSCSRPMQFLFQIGDFLELDGDAPVVYVYGCSQHPAEVKAHVDMY